MGWAPGTAAPESREFNNGTGDWNVAGNWTPPGVPVVGDRANIRDGDTVNVTDSPPATDVTLDGGTINVDGGHLRLGSKEGHIELATGTIILGAGTIEQVATWTRMGDRPGGTLTWNQSGGIARIYHNAGAPSANDATLDFNISGGEYHANGIPLPHPDASDPLLDIDVSGTGFVRLERIGPAHTRISLLDTGAVIAVRTEQWENFLAAVDTPWKLTEGPEADFTYVEGTGEGAPPPDEEEDGEAPFVSPWSWKDRLLPEYGEEPIRTGRNVRLGAFTWVFTGWTNEERNRWVGSHFEAFSYDHVGYYYSSADVRMMRETNPAIFLGLSFCPQILDVKAQSYLNVGGWDPSSMGDWVLRLADGGEAPNQLWSFEDTHVMDVGNPAWSDYFRDRAAMWVERAGADGMFLDGTPWGGAYYPDPSKLRDYDSREEIEAATRAFVDNLRKVTMVIDDEWKNGRQEHLDGLWDEGWMGYDSTIPTWGFDSPARWETAVATVEQVSARKKLDLSQGWYHYGNRFELEYLVASYLLGKRSNSALFQPCPMGSPHLPDGAPYDLSCFAADVYAAELEAYPEIFEVEMGPAMGGRYPVEEHLWVRDFERGRVYVNASLTESRVVDLEETMQNVDDGAVDRVTLAPRTGAILRRPGGTAVTDVGEVAPRQSRLAPNYPNPFNGRTVLRFAVGREGLVELAVYDLQGQLVRRLVSGERDSGFYETAWDGTNADGHAVASGVYVSRLQVGSSFRESRKMMLMR